MVGQTVFQIAYDPVVSTTAVWTVLISTILALSINIFLLTLVWRLRSYWHLFSFQLLIALALIDLSSCFNALMTCIFRFILGYPKVFDVGWYCSSFGLGVVYFHCMSGVLVSVMALERYCLVCHRRSLWRTTTWVALGGIAILLAIPMVANAIDHGHVPDPTHTYCWSSGSFWSPIQGYFTTTLLAIPLFMLTFCYISIFTTCLKSGLHGHEFYGKQASIRALVFMGFYVTIYIPNFILTIYERFYDLEQCPIILLVLGPAFLTLTTSTNPFLALILHKKIKSEAVFVLTGRQPSLKKNGGFCLQL